MPCSLFLTGADGYLGTHLLERMDPSRFEKIHCLTVAGGRRSPAPNITYVRGDLLDPRSYAGFLRGCDTVLHMAAVTGKAPREAYFRVNRDGTKALLDSSRAAGVSRFLFISSIAAGFRDQTRYYYAQSKREAEECVKTSGFDYLIVRPTILMGPGSPVLASLSKLAGAPVMPVFGDGSARVQPVSAADLATFLLDTILGGPLGNRVVEFGGPEAMTIEDLLLKIRRIRFGKPRRVVHLPAAPVAAILGALEKVFLPVLPLTAGQLASFTNDGTAQTSPGTYHARETLEDILERS